jgi:hypothetical protein
MMEAGRRPLMPNDGLLKVDEAKVLARFDELWVRLGERNAAIPEEEVERDITAAFRSVRGLPHPGLKSRATRGRP